MVTQYYHYQPGVFENRIDSLKVSQLISGFKSRLKIHV